MRVRSDKHHILHERQEWTLRPAAEYLREHPSLVPRIDRQLHEVLHRVAPAVPLLGHHALRHVVNDYQPGANTLESMDNLLLSIDYASRHPRAHSVEVRLAELAIEAISIQRDILRGNVIE
jgi:hypothetical protein